jgi:membrane-bound serine protease (ClpP class)
LAEKVTNDAVASIRSMAELRGRNADWAERAVRESANLPASEAARLGVVDLIADDVPDLLRKIEGRTVRLPQGESRIAVGDGAPTPRPMNPLERFLLVLTDPTIAYLLLSLGGLALVYELASPGAILPGVVGGIALLLALYSLGTLPVNIAGVGLILFALLLFFADLALGGSGVLTVGGVISFALGSLLLAVWPETQAYARVLLPAGAAMTVVIAAFFGAITVALVRTRLQRSSIAQETLVGASGLTRTEVGAQGTVFVAGEMWVASASDPDQPIPAGERVRVVSVDGLRLTIQPEEAGV